MARCACCQMRPPRRCAMHAPGCSPMHPSSGTPLLLLFTTALYCCSLLLLFITALYYCSLLLLFIAALYCCSLLLLFTTALYYCSLLLLFTTALYYYYPTHPSRCFPMSESNEAYILTSCFFWRVNTCCLSTTTVMSKK